MNTKAKSCYLKSKHSSLLTIYLPDSTAVFVGRSPESNITDTKCSRQQVKVYADYTEYKVCIEQVGVRACGFNGCKTQKGVEIVGKHNDCIDILHGKYSYQIEFNPPPFEAKHQPPRKKRSYQSEESDEITDKDSHKMQKTEDTSSEDKKQSEESASNSHNKKEKLKNAEVTSSAEVTAENTEKQGKWESIGNAKLLIYSAAGIQNQAKIAAFDMDGTLIKTKSGLVFPKDCNDWQLLYPEVPGKLKQAYADGYKIVIFTNQRGLGSGKIKINDFKLKIERIVQKLGVPIQVFIAAGDSIYRKPTISMWEALTNNKNGSVVIDIANCFYVGDAAGRQKNWAPGKKKDHSSADRLFALNVGLKFLTPEEYFLGQKPAPYLLPTFNPKKVVNDASSISPEDTKYTSNEQEMILMVGCPGSGKSHFVKSYLTEYKHVNRDTLGSWQKCVAAMDEFLTQGKSVVVDNTNPDPSSRKRYVEIAKKRNVPVRCFVMKTTTEHTKHNNKFRELTDPSHMKIADLVINSYMKNYVPPTMEEGFKEIVEINFIPKFRTEEERKLYEMYLLEH